METPLDTMKHIESQALTISDNFNDQATYFPTRVLPKDMGLHSLEEHMEFRNHYRAKMLTNSVPDFVNYFTTNNGENCFIDAEEMRAKTIFDIGTIEEPKHCKHVAYLELKKTAAFKELEKANGNHFSQKDMAEWIEEWNDLISASEDVKGEEDIALSKAIAAIRRVTIEEITKSDHGQSNFKSDRSTLESIEAKSDEALPSFFHFTCTPYEGLKENTFTLRMSILKSHGSPGFVLRVLRYEAIEEELANEFKDLLVKELPEECLTYIGELSV